jgi:GNAT superfamily N-acetyltransferase
LQSEITIRAYESGDRDAVWSLMLRTPMPDGTLPTSVDIPLELANIAANFAAFWVALDGVGSIIGTVGLQDTALHPAAVPLPPFLEASGSNARLRRLDVDPAHQRKRIGRQLTQIAIDWAGGAGYERIVLDTTTLQLPAIALYESMGFRRAGQSRFQRWDLVWFTLELAT